MPTPRVVRTQAPSGESAPLTPTGNRNTPPVTPIRPVSEETRTERYARLVVAKHASLITLDQFGKEVPTVVWVAPYAGRLLVWVAAGSGLARRLRANTVIRIAACDEQGRLLADPSECTGRILFPEEAPTVYAAMNAKYGWRFTVVRAAGFIGRLLFIRPRGYLGIELILQ